MSFRIDPVLNDIYRISTFSPEVGITFNQFLIVDERPALIHTGTFPMYEEVRAAIAKVMDPAKLAYVIVPHFEADECGGMTRFVQGSPKSTLLCSEAGHLLNFSAWDFAGPHKGMKDGEKVELGKHKLRFLETPHVHHWDSMMVVEETTASLFPADLFIQPGEQPVTSSQNMGSAMCALYRGAGIFAAARPVLDVVDRVSQMKLRWIHPMHGASLPAGSHEPYYNALRTEPFIYEGTILGRRFIAT
jgi:flavorubredoxin